MNCSEWIKKKLKKYSVKEIYAMYKIFQTETGSMMSMESFKGTVRSLNTKINGNALPNIKKEFKKDEQYIESTSTTIATQEDLLNYAKINIDDWNVEKCVVNTWGNPQKPNYQIKCWLKKKSINFKAFKENLQKDLKEYSPKSFNIIKRKVFKEPYLLKIDIPDFHFGLLSWNKETGDGDFDLKIAKNLFAECISYFLEITKPFNIEKILFPVGSDFFNVNNQLKSTAKGTLQDEDCRWQKSFTEGRKILVEGIDTLREIADVDIMVIPGNHDEERAFYVGETLYAWYRNDKHVHIDNSPKVYKFYEWEKNLIGITHGDGAKPKDLPLLLATEAKEAWGRALCTEFHHGHWHHEIVKEFNKVKVRCIPALSPLSAWAAKKGFKSSRESLAHIFHPTKGNIAQFNFRV